MKYKIAGVFERDTINLTDIGELEQHQSMTIGPKVVEDHDGRNVIRGLLEELPGWRLTRLEMKEE